MIHTRNRNNSSFLSFFPIPTSFYLLTVGAEGHCCTRPHSTTRVHTR